MNKYEETLKRFDDRQAEKPKALLFPFNATLTLTIKAVDDQTAEETLAIVVKHLNKFDDLSNVEGSFE
jgi:hypothetical protein